jgi:hypothetical protein
LVHGSAALLVPEEPGARIEISASVFRLFALKWRRVPKRTLVAAWLIRTTCFMVARQRRLLKLPTPVPTSMTGLYDRLFRKLNAMPVTLREPLILLHLLRESVTAAGSALGGKEARIVRLADRGLARLAKLFAEPRSLLHDIPAPVSSETESSVLTRLAELTTTRKKNDLMRGAWRSWRWLGLKRRFWKTSLAFGVGLGLLLIAGGTLAWLGQQGYLTLPMLQFAGRQMIKDVPELLQAARSWPSPPEQKPWALQTPPKTSSDLYGLTNIWLARLSFTPEAWHQIAPSHIPPISMHGPDGQMVLRNPKSKRSGLAGVLGIEFNWTKARLEFAGLDYTNVSVRYRGNGTYVNSLFGPKQSFKVAVDKAAKNQTVGGARVLNFVNAIPDNSYLHDALGERLFRDLGAPGPRTSYAYLTLDVPGKFANQALGLYVLIENVDADFALDRFGSKTVPIFKPVTTELFKDLGNDWTAYAPIYDLKTEATSEQKDRVIQFSKLVTSASDDEFARRLSEFLDLEEFAAFLGGHVLLSSYDGFLANGQNIYVYLDPRSNRFGFIPWDQDHAWGEFGYVATADQRERASIWEPSTYHDQFLERVLKVEEFRAIYRRQLEHALASLFTVERLDSQVDELAALLRPAVAAESDFRLHRFDLAVSTNWLSGPRDGAPEGPKAPVHQIKRFIANRVQSVRDQLDDKAKGVVLTRR